MDSDGTDCLKTKLILLHSVVCIDELCIVDSVQEIDIDEFCNFRIGKS